MRREPILMRVLGLTGSLGMGKSTTADFFADEGVPVLNADAVVHRLYAGAAVPLIESAFPGTSVDGRIDRARLAERVIGDAEALKRLEAIIHPLVRREEKRFIEDARASGAMVAVLDVPLLFETGAERLCDAVVVVTAPAEVQRRRALARPGMSEDKLEALLAKQMSDEEKRRRADFVVDSSQGFDFARAQVRAILRTLAAGPIRPASTDP
jgi:dephospho-CoA kinase